MKKYILAAILLLPCSGFAQLPLPVLPDWLNPNQGATTEVLIHTHVTLTGNNFIILQSNIVAKSKGFKLLGLISLRSASHTEAMSRLYAKAQLQQRRPQALANVVRETTSTSLILFSIPKVTIRADLIEFTGQDDEDSESDDAAPVFLKTHSLKRRSE